MTARSTRPRSHPSSPRPEEFARVLHARGQRATPQRYAILRELRERGRHATAEEIGRAVRARMPGTSIPTVYATLDLLVELGLVRRIDTAHGAAVYDGGSRASSPHGLSPVRRVTDLAGELDTAAGWPPPGRRVFALRALSWSSRGCALAAPQAG